MGTSFFGPRCFSCFLRALFSAFAPPARRHGTSGTCQYRVRLHQTHSAPRVVAHSSCVPRDGLAPWTVVQQGHQWMSCSTPGRERPFLARVVRVPCPPSAIRVWSWTAFRPRVTCVLGWLALSVSLSSFCCLSSYEIGYSADAKEPSSTMLYVSNLPFSFEDADLKAVFQGFEVTSAYVATRRNGRSKVGDGLVVWRSGLTSSSCAFSGIWIRDLRHL
jgi:hypothetical protein